jgi:hypothetical protein
MLARATRHPAVCWSVIPPLYLRLEKVRAISLPAPVEEPRLAMEDDLMILDELKFDRIGHIQDGFKLQLHSPILVDICADTGIGSVAR